MVVISEKHLVHQTDLNHETMIPSPVKNTQPLAYIGDCHFFLSFILLCTPSSDLPWNVQQLVTFCFGSRNILTRYENELHNYWYSLGKVCCPWICPCPTTWRSLSHNHLPTAPSPYYSFTCPEPCHYLPSPLTPLTYPIHCQLIPIITPTTYPTSNYLLVFSSTLLLL